MKYILYARKSSESEDRQALSIQSQIDEMQRIADKEGLEVVRIFQESKSAKKPGREKFNEMVKFIQKGNADAILCWKIDRLARNPVDEGLIKWLQQTEVIKQIKTFDREYNTDDNILLASIEFSMANQYIRDLSKNVKRGNRAKLNKGQWPSQAPFGYLNDTVNKIVFPDPDRAKFVRKTFDLYAHGNVSTNEIGNILYKEGLRTWGGRKVGKSTIHRVLVNPFYYGTMLRDGKYYNGCHEPIISKQLFDQAQDVLLGKINSKKQKHVYPYRGFMTCAVCGCTITADKKKGHTYYYCTDGKGICKRPRKFLRSEHVDRLIGHALGTLHFDKKFIEISYLAAQEKLLGRKDTAEDTIARLKKQLKMNSERQGTLLDRHLDKIVLEDVYRAKTRQLEKDRIDLERELMRIQKSGKGNFTFEPVKNIFLRANKAQKAFQKEKDDGKRHLMEILLSNLSIEDGNLASISFKMPYQLLANTPKNCTFEKMLGC